MGKPPVGPHSLRVINPPRAAGYRYWLRAVDPSGTGWILWPL